MGSKPPDSKRGLPIVKAVISETRAPVLYMSIRKTEFRGARGVEAMLESKTRASSRHAPQIEVCVDKNVRSFSRPFFDFARRRSFQRATPITGDFQIAS